MRHPSDNFVEDMIEQEKREQVAAFNRSEDLNAQQVDLNDSMTLWAGIAGLGDEPGWVSLMRMTFTQIEQLRASLETCAPEELPRIQGALMCFKWLESIPRLAEVAKESLLDQQRTLDDMKDEYIEHG